MGPLRLWVFNQQLHQLACTWGTASFCLQPHHLLYTSDSRHDHKVIFSAVSFPSQYQSSMHTPMLLPTLWFWPPSLSSLPVLESRKGAENTGCWLLTYMLCFATGLKYHRKVFVLVCLSDLVAKQGMFATPSPDFTPLQPMDGCKVMARYPFWAKVEYKRQVVYFVKPIFQVQ